VRFVLPLAAVAALAACSEHKAEFDGIGPWHIGKTTRKDGVRCDPVPKTPDLVWCYLNPNITFAEQQATVDLYFHSNADDAPLAEILVDIQSCRPDGLDRALTSKLGVATEAHGHVLVWRGKVANIVAELPKADGECQISFLAPSETARLDELVAEGAAQGAATH
jgi:hypothetical protein